MTSYNFANENKEFLSQVGIDYVSLHNLYGIVAKGFKNHLPNKNEFKLIIQFILFLFNKYDKNFHYTSGPGDRIDKSLNELLKWMQQEYVKGHYRDISYSIWFHLDESVIPKEYLPYSDEKK